MNKKIIQLSLKVDSLAHEVDQKERFIQNIQSIIKGEDVDEFETADLEEPTSPNDLNKEIDLSQVSAIDSVFRREFEESGIEVVRVKNTEDFKLQELFFFSPLADPVVSSPYSAKNEHFGVDLVAKEGEPIKSISDGTVIFSGFQTEGGYMMAIQHRNNLISVYKHNSSLLKKVGTFVNEGEIIAIIGNTGELTTAPHLHFELWYNGYAVNPEEFVKF
ncbi:M23 family metallopeptidase [Fulvivirgaceae bacterium BMA10]|uniref:M23 family metallopeptidase n=1 Tax=Splendidivirga corallicola TaxID=3051826 RepID=A0ABT8KUK6_9BACT|nr:M23 family metallopeptidase [Fulvivirgaceae bacterium BMA10]